METVSAERVTVCDMERAVDKAFEGRGSKQWVKRWLRHKDANIARLMKAVSDGSYAAMMEYRKLDVTNNNGKKRSIDAPMADALILQHLWLQKVRPLYDMVNPGVARNCLPGHGITAHERTKSVLRECKRMFYDRRDLTWLVDIDQRQCYQRLSVRAYRRGMKSLRRLLPPGMAGTAGYWRWLTDFGERVSFVGGRLPIGTPTSPHVHHVAMLEFDCWLRDAAPWCLRYADNVYCATDSRKEAAAMLWRIRQRWWYTLGMLARRHTAHVVNIDRRATDICGYVLTRNRNRQPTDHDKGTARMRRATMRNALLCGSDVSWASYFGLMRHADCYRLMQAIEKRMKLSELTERIRIDRDLDARHIDMKDLEGLCHDLLRYEIRRTPHGEPNWMKGLIGVREVDGDGQPTGRTLAYEYHGNYQGIIRWLIALEEGFGGRTFLPVEDGVIVNQCGYIYEGSTNQLRYLEDDK